MLERPRERSVTLSERPKFFPLCIPIACLYWISPTTFSASAPTTSRNKNTLDASRDKGGEHSTGASAIAKLSATSAADTVSARAAKDIENANTSNANKTNEL
jgi:hypothetical protein